MKFMSLIKCGNKLVDPSFFIIVTNRGTAKICCFTVPTKLSVVGVIW